MTKESSSFPVKTARGISLKNEDVSEIKKELVYTHGYDEESEAKFYNCARVSIGLPAEVMDRYESQRL